MNWPGRFLLSLFLLPVIYSNSQAQTCVDPLKTINYDTTLLGTGNGYAAISFPKFDATLGTLMEIRLEAEVTLKYSFQLENRENIPISNYRVRVTREDEVSGPALINPIYNSQVRTYGSYSLAAWDGIAGSGTDYTARGPLYVMNHAVVSQTVYNTADYLGTGTVDFDYNSTTYSSVLGSVNYTFNATAQDTIIFRLRYTYCPTWFLKADVTSFTAIKNKFNGVDLNWTTENEEKDRLYEIQKSFDGKTFETIAGKKARAEANLEGHYQHIYSFTGNDNHPKIIFRLKQIEPNGDTKYSVLRIIDRDMTTSPEMKVFPNPASQYIQMVFSGKQRGNWKVELLSATGAVLRQQTFSNSLTGRIEGLASLAKGMYFIRATEQATGLVKKQVVMVQ